MYKDPGAQRDAWLTAKPYGLGTFRNDTFYDVHPQNEYKREKTGDGFRKIWEKTRVASRTAKDAIKKAYYWTGIWAAATAALAGGLGYSLAKYGGDYHAWLKEALAGGTLASAFELYKHVDRRSKERKREMEKLREENENESLKKDYIDLVRNEYLGLMKRLMESDLEPDEKINLRYYMGVDRFTSKLLKNQREKECKIEQLNGLRGDLESMETCMERYIEKRSSNHGKKMPGTGNSFEDDGDWYKEEAVA